MADHDCSSSAAEERELQSEAGYASISSNNSQRLRLKTRFPTPSSYLSTKGKSKTFLKKTKNKKPPSTIFYGLNLQDSFSLVNGFPISSPNIIM